MSNIFHLCEIGDLENIKKIINTDELRVNLRNLKNQNILHVSCFYNKCDIVLYLIQYYPFLINQRDKNGSLPIHYSCLNGNKQITENLLKYSYCYSTTLSNFNLMGITPFHYACRSGNLELVYFLLTSVKEHNIDLLHVFEMKNEKKNSLMFACLSGNYSLVKYLIDLDSSLLTYLDSSNNCLYYYTHYQSDENIIKLIKDYYKEYPQIFANIPRDNTQIDFMADIEKSRDIDIIGNLKSVLINTIKKL